MVSKLEVLVIETIRMAYTIVRTLLPVVLIRKPERKKIHEVAGDMSACP